MSTSRSIRKNIKKNNFNKQVIYPYAWSVFTILTGILSAFVIVDAFALFLMLFKDNKLNTMLDYLIILSFIIPLLSISIYMLLIDYALVKRKIYFEYSHEGVMLKSIWKTKIIKLEDIELITTQSGFRRFNSIVIQAAKNRDKNSSKKIAFPIIWFGKENIKIFIQSMVNSNIVPKKAKIDVVF